MLVSLVSQVQSAGWDPQCALGCSLFTALCSVLTVQCALFTVFTVHTATDTEHHPSYNIQPATSMPYFFFFIFLYNNSSCTLLCWFFFSDTIECWSPNWGRPVKTYATLYCDEVSVLYLLFLEYRRFPAQIGKPLHLEYFLQPAAMCNNTGTLLSKTWKSVEIRIDRGALKMVGL